MKELDLGDIARTQLGIIVQDKLLTGSFSLHSWC